MEDKVTFLDGYFTLLFLNVTACERGWRNLKKAGIDRIDLECLEALDMGDGLVADRSTYVLYDEDGEKIDNGK